MIYYMNSRVFFREYLNLEKNWKILDTYYIVVSMRIARPSNSRNEMIQTATPMLYPCAEVMMKDNLDEMKTAYLRQLKSSMRYFAVIIKGSIKKHYDFVFLSTRNEEKVVPYLKWIAEFIMDTFGYPVFSYHKLFTGKEHLIEYDEEAVLKKCKEVLDKKKESKDISEWSKATLRKNLKKRGVYTSKDCTKEELLEMYFECLTKKEILDTMGNLD